MKITNKKIKVGILGATGMVGQRFISLLEDHPWFEVSAVAASKQSSGKAYGKAVEKKWAQDKLIPEDARNLVVYCVEDDAAKIAGGVDFVFSAIEANKEIVQKIEEKYASLGLPVVSNNSAHRWTPDVPMIIPEVNPEHLGMIETQKQNHGWDGGFIVVKPNCSIQSYVPLIHAWQEFGPKQVIVSTYQAISGAGKTLDTWPEMTDNVIPYIGGEEEKSQREPAKILAKIVDNKFVLNNAVKISASCVRVPVSDGHLTTINIGFNKKISKEELISALENFKNPLESLGLPSAPKLFITYMSEDDRPQTKLDKDLGGGMGISVGRLRQDPVPGWKCVALSHNTIRGAAGGAILLAELLVSRGYIKKP
jgi:aspartate-semialdehyde dehydrogenase